jgi:hypothetical protein
MSAWEMPSEISEIQNSKGHGWSARAGDPSFLGGASNLWVAKTVT